MARTEWTSVCGGCGWVTRKHRTHRGLRIAQFFHDLTHHPKEMGE